MSASSPAKIATIGLLGVVALTLMMLMSVSSMTDTGSAGHAQQLRSELARSLIDSRDAVVVSMVRVGDEGGDRARRYTVRLQPSAAVSGDSVALERLLQRAARVVSGRIGGPVGQVAWIECIADLGGGETTSAEFRRVVRADALELARVAAE